MFDIRKAHTEHKSKTYSLYFERNGYSYGYAHFTLIQDLGIVQAYTDWGNYSYRWTSIGDDTLEEFLSDLDCGYIVIKFCGRPKELDDENTKKSLIRDVFIMRREHKITAKEARDLYEMVLDCDYTVSPDLFFALLPSEILDTLYGGDYTAVPIQKMYDGHQSIFVDEIFPAFQQYLKTHVLMGW